MQISDQIQFPVFFETDRQTLGALNDHLNSIYNCFVHYLMETHIQHFKYGEIIILVEIEVYKEVFSYTYPVLNWQRHDVLSRGFQVKSDFHWIFEITACLIIQW